VSLIWLTYKTAGRLSGVLILESPDPLQARFRAGVFGLDQGAEFAEGHPLDEALAAAVPERLIGRMLSIPDAQSLIRRFERIDPIPIDPQRPQRDAPRRGSNPSRRIDGRAGGPCRLHVQP
jgi:hypothetical protein